MAIPLHTFEPTGDPFVDDLQFELRGGKPPFFDTWFRDNRHVLRYTTKEIAAQAESYSFSSDVPAQPGIYVLLSGDKVIYVGKALSIADRISAHERNRKRFDRYWCFGGMPYTWLGEVEAFYIERLKPTLNRAHVIAKGGLKTIAAESA